MTAESWKTVFDVGTVVLLFLTFAFGAGVLFTGNAINKRQAEELSRFRLRIESEQQKTASAQTEAAKAQLALKQYVDLVAKSTNARLILDPKRFIEILKGKPTGTVEIWFEPNDPEAREFAGNLSLMLGPSEAGWKVEELKALPLAAPEIPQKSGERTVLEDLRIAASTGLAIGSNMLDPFDATGKTTRGALVQAINFGTGGWNISGVGGHFEQAYPSIPDGHFIIVVGHHRVNVPLVEFTPPKQ